MRTCTRCHVDKDESEFYRNPTHSGGLGSYCKDCDGLIKTARRHELRRQVVSLLGGVCACPGCGEDRPWFLTIDHTDNDGAEHRRNTKSVVTRYREILTGECNYKVQLLCYNCNGAKEVFGSCPGHRPKEGKHAS